VLAAAPKFVAECLQRSGVLPIHVSFKWDSNDPDYDSSVFDDDGSVADDDHNAVDEDSTNQTLSGESGDSDDETASHSTLSIYPDHRDTRYPWTTFMKEAQGYHHLMQHSHRIVTLDISLPVSEDDEDEDNPLACGLLFYPFPALQTLKLRCLPGSRGSIPKIILDEHITTVKSLLLENILLTQIVDLSLNITSLNLTTPEFVTQIDTGLLLRFLKKNHNLVSLTFHGYKFLPFPETTAPVVLSNLRKLDFRSDSVTFLRHLAALPLEKQSFFKMESAYRRFLLSAENSAAGTSTSVSTLPPSEDPDDLLSIISGVFGSGWEEATHVAVVVPVKGWERGFVDRFLDRLTRLGDLSMECRGDRVDPWLDSLAASKDRCPKLRRVRFHIPPEYCPTALRSVRKLVKQRAEDGIPLETVEQTGLPPSTVGIWNDLYERWRIEDYLTTKDS